MILANDSKSYWRLPWSLNSFMIYSDRTRQPRLQINKHGTYRFFHCFARRLYLLSSMNSSTSVKFFCNHSYSFGVILCTIHRGRLVDPRDTRAHDLSPPPTMAKTYYRHPIFFHCYAPRSGALDSRVSSFNNDSIRIVLWYSKKENIWLLYNFLTFFFFF